MPDIGGFGRGLLRGALTATEKAADKVKDAAEAASRKMDTDDADVTQPVSDPDATLVIRNATDPDATQVVVQGTPGPPRQPAAATQLAVADEPTLADEPEDHADASEVRELVEMFQQLLDKHRPPAGPIPGEWSLGVGDLLAAHPKVPTRVRGLVTKLNRFGGVSYSPQEVTFDGDDVPWEKVTEARTRHIVDYLVGDAVQQQVENLPMPWFPGRKRLLDALGQAILTVTIATAKNQLEKLELGMRIPAEISYKASFGRTKELGAGVVSALVLADPAVNQSLLATARARGVKIVEDKDEMLASADERAEKIREKVAALEAELERFTKRFGRQR
jgi:hypothetical protein